LLDKYNYREEGVKRVNQVCKKRRTSREFRLNANIGDFNMGDIIPDLGSEVNVLLKKTWEAMGEPQLGYSLIQLKLENQHRVVPIGTFKGIHFCLFNIRVELGDFTSQCDNIFFKLFNLFFFLHYLRLHGFFCSFYFFKMNF
jgi:hypothetical protein